MRENQENASIHRAVLRATEALQPTPDTDCVTPAKLIGTVMDVTEQKRVEEERGEHLWFLESMDRVNRAMQRTHDVEGMLSGVLEETLAIFGSDRAWLVYPCDPDAATSRVVMEHTRPEYPGAFALGEEFPVDTQGAELLRRVLDAPGAVTDLTIPPEMRERFSIQSIIATAVRPKGDRPYLFGLHQCSHARAWTAAERRLFEEIDRRLEDALTSVLAHRNLLAREEELRRSQHYLSEAQKLSHTGSWAVNLSSNTILYWSEECYRIYAYDPAQGLPSFESAVERVHPEDRPAVLETVDKAVQKKADFQTEHRVILPGGIVRNIRCLANTVWNASGELIYIGTVMDVTEQKRAEEALLHSGAALKLSEERYALAMEAAADGHMDWNFLTGEFYISPRMLQIVGHPLDATFADRADWVARFPFHPEDRKRWETAVAAHFAGREAIFKMDLRIVVNGEMRWLAFNFIATRDAAGKVVRWTGSITDLTDAKRDVATVVESIPGLVAILTPAGEVDAVNDQLAEYCGQPLEAMKQWGTNGTVHAEDLPRVAEIFMRGISTGEPYELEARVRRFDGVYRWNQIRGHPSRDSDGRIVRWYSVIFDIDDRKRAEEALRESQERYALAVAGSDDGVWDIDFAAARVFISARARELAGIPPGPEIVPLEEWFANLPLHPDDVPMRLAAMQAHLTGKAPAYEGEYRLRQPDGVYRWRRLHGLCLRNADGKPQRMAGSISDVDARRRAEDESARIREALRARDACGRGRLLGLGRPGRRVVRLAEAARDDAVSHREPIRRAGPISARARPFPPGRLGEVGARGRRSSLQAAARASR